MIYLSQFVSRQSVNTVGLPQRLSGKESTCQRRRPGFDPWVRKIPWRRKWQPTPVFLPGKSHGQRSLAGYSPWGCKGSDTTERRHSSLQNHLLLFRQQNDTSLTTSLKEHLPFSFLSGSLSHSKNLPCLGITYSFIVIYSKHTILCTVNIRQGKF